MPDTDQELIQRFVHRGDREALGALFRRHAEGAFWTAIAILRDAGDAEDAVQEAFAQLMAKAPALAQVEAFPPWVRKLVARTALNLARSERRRAGRERRHPLSQAPEDPAMHAVDREIRERLRAEVDRLPEELRLPVVLHYQAGCTHADAAEVLGLPPSTLTTRLAAARERLKAVLATAGVVLVAGVSLEEALAESAPAAPMPASLPLTLEALPDAPEPTTAGADKAGGKAIPHAFGPWGLAAAALVLAAAGTGLALRGRPAPALPANPAPAPRPVAGERPPASVPVAPVPAAPVPVPAAESPAPATVPMAALIGRVVCRETGQPIPDAGVSVHAWSGTQAIGSRQATRTGPEGHFRLAVRLEDPASDRTGTTGDFVLEVSAPGFAPCRRNLQRPMATELDGYQVNPARDEADAGPFKAGEERRRDVALLRGWGLVIRLKAPDGSVPPVRITLSRGGDALAFGEGWSELSALRGAPEFDLPQSPDGGFEIHGLDPARFPPSETILVIADKATAPSFAPIEIRSLHALPSTGDRFLLDLVLDRGRTLRGTVLSPHDVPAERTVILCWPSRIDLARARAEGRVREINGSDAFALTGLPLDEPLSIWSRVRHKEYGEGVMEVPIEIPAGREDAECVLRLEGGGEVSGRVLDGAGLPLEGARLEASFRGDKAAYGVSASAEAGPDGRYVLKGLPRWPGLVVRCSHACWEDGEAVGARVGAGGLDFRLSAIR